MRIGKRLFPYPVLNSDKLHSQYKKSVFSLHYDEELSEDGQYYLLKYLRCELDNPMLLELIRSDRAEIVCVIECSSTMYRRKQVLSLEPVNLSIPLADLNNKVHVSAFVVAKEDIHGYWSEDFLDDYENLTFSIEKHDILAADDGYVNTIDFNEPEDNRRSSIFLVIKDKSISDGSMQVDYNTEKIIIALPEEQWNMYDKTKRIVKYEKLYFSILAVPALSYALSKLQKTDPSVDILRMEYSWFHSFTLAYKNHHGEELSDDVFLKMNTNLEAQLLLGTPVSGAIDEIFHFTIGLSEGDDNVDQY